MLEMSIMCIGLKKEKKEKKKRTREQENKRTRKNVEEAHCIGQ